MDKNRLLTRRRFLAGMAMALGGGALAWLQRLVGVPKTAAQPPAPTRQAFLPDVPHGLPPALTPSLTPTSTLSPTPSPGRPRVVHIRDAAATAWDGSGAFYEAVDCVMVDLLVAEGRLSTTHPYDCLFCFCAVEAGLGLGEGTRAAPGGDPWQTPYGSGYQAIEYIREDVV